MAFRVKIEPEPASGEVSIWLSDGIKKSEEMVYKGKDTTINFDAEPKKLIARRNVSIIKQITQSFYCKYVDVTTDNGPVFYFPVFRKISAAEVTVEESSGKILDLEDPEKEEAEPQEVKGVSTLRCSQLPRHAVLKLTKELAGKLPQQEDSKLREPLNTIKKELKNRVYSLQSLQEAEFGAALKASGRSEFISPTKVTAVPRMLSAVSEAKEDSSEFPSDAAPKKKTIFGMIVAAISFLLSYGKLFSKKLKVVPSPEVPYHADGKTLFELPMDLWFGPIKFLDVIGNAVLVNVQTFVRRICNFWRPWRKLDDIKRVFLFPSKKAEYISQHWKEDEFFGRQFLDGCNPIMIERCNEIPQKIPVEDLKAVYPDIKELVQKGEIYIVDYKLLNNVQEDVIDGHQQYLAAPIVLLQQKEDKLMPIAIQLKQEPGKENPVFTPADNEHAWLLAKLWVRNSDFYVHELVSHLLRTHLLAEVFFLNIYTSLYSCHPILRAFMATGRYTLPLNVTARSTLIGDDGFFLTFTGLTKDGLQTVMGEANKDITFESLCLPDNLKKRGLMELKNFYYRDDGLALWNAIHEFLDAVVNNKYTSDEEMCKDHALQSLFMNIYISGFEGKLDFPSKVETRDEAVKYLTMIMFTCSAQHAAVNHGQYDVYAWMPNGPITMRQPPPKVKDQVTEKYIMNTLPILETTLEAMSISRFLSQVPKDFVPLGKYADDVANDPCMREPVKKFQETLKGIGKKIEERAAGQEFPYMYLHPDHMENSIAI